MGILAKLFGRIGVVHFEGITNSGQEFDGKTGIEIIGDPDNKDIIKKLKKQIYQSEGIAVKKIRIQKIDWQ